MKKYIILLLLMIFFVCTSSHAGPARFKMKQAGILNGQAMVNNSPLANSMLSFFLVEKGLPPIEKGMQRIPEVLIGTDDAGNFNIKLLPGTYYIGMLLNPAKDRPSGPPRGDEKYFFAANPDGSLRQITIQNYDQIDAGIVIGNPPETFEASELSITVRGQVVDISGQPIEHMLVFAKEQMNQNRPDFISDRTDEDGVFFIRLPPEKSFYLFARKEVANMQPGPGSSMGIYGVIPSSEKIPSPVTGYSTPPAGVPSGVRTEANTPLPLSGTAGTELTGLKIYLYEIPDAKDVEASLRGTDLGRKFQNRSKVSNIYFAFDSATIEEKYFHEIDRWADFLKKTPDAKIEILGHTDSRGNDQYNQELSVNRVSAIVDYLLSKEVPDAQLTGGGYGEKQPVADNSTEEGRSLNRRVVIKFLK